MNSNESRPLLFISHRHADSQIADVIRSFITTRSGGRVDVFQSSAADAKSPRIGQKLNQELMDNLWKAGAIILIYTITDQNWSYCMWECGVALDPRSPDTKIIVFQCADDSPAPFADQVRVNICNLVDIQKFTKDFLTNPNFFPNFGQAITQFQENSLQVIEAAQELYQRLEQVSPHPGGEVDEWPAWPFLQLELCLEKVNIICNAPQDQRLMLATEILQRECLVSTGDYVAAQQLFGIPNLRTGMSFQELIEIWRENNSGSHSKWVEAICTQISRGARWKFPELTWELMRGSNNNWYAPVLNRVRKIPNKNCMQFDIYFYKFDINPKDTSIQISIPSVD